MSVFLRIMQVNNNFDKLQASQKKQANSQKERKKMVVKLWDDGKQCWTFLDGFKKVDHWRTEKDEVKFINLLCYYKDEKEMPLSIELDVTKEELVHSIYLLNDDGKTIERIN